MIITNIVRGKNQPSLHTDIMAKKLHSLLIKFLKNNRTERGACMKNMARMNREKKNILVSEKGGYQGLCSCCVNLTICTFIKNSSQPVLYCEEFDDDDRSVREIAHPIQKARSKEKSYLENHKGLCVTCEHCDKCIFPKQEGGVWRCEEYR